MNGFDLARELSSRADRIIVSLFQKSFRKNQGAWCLAALGGYGRRELCPFSDLDLLFLVDRRTSLPEIERVLKDMLYPLWDTGFDAGYSVRTLRQAVDDAGTDFFFCTSLLDARHLCGSEDLFRKFARAVVSARPLKRPGRFISDLLSHTRRRHEKYGDTSYFLEPHIKDGHGGLRDFQSILWALKVSGSSGSAQAAPLIDASDCADLCEAAGFMLKTRFILHAITGRKTDRMHLEHQEALAESMGYRPHSSESAVEGFLRVFHTRAVTVRAIFDSLILYLYRPGGIRRFLHRPRKDGPLAVSRGLLSFSDPEGLKEHPLTAVSAFEKMACEGLTLTPGARACIKNIARSGPALKESPEGFLKLMRILRAPGARDTLISMLETGVLEQLIPEFGAIRGRTIFDVYHTYTVDLHSIHAVCELNGLIQSENDIFARVSDLDVLYFSTFLHDIGKGSGRPHAVKGAEIIRSIARRFGFDHAQTDLAAFLVQNHLLMADLAFSRDLSEEKVIGDFALKAASPERLSLLYLLTVADSRATGASAWSEWKASLLRELYIRTLNILEKGIFKDPENAMRLEEKWDRLIGMARTGEGFQGRLWALPQAYILSFDVGDIGRHLALSSTLAGRDDIRAHIAHRKNHTFITFITRDRPGLFSLLTGILAVNRLEAVSARIFTWYDGTVVDAFKVIAPWQDYHGWHTIEEQCRDVLSGKTDIEARIRRTASLRTSCPDPVPPRETFSLSIDNGSSDFFSIIDVRAPSSIGLIHDVSLAIGGSGLDIHRAFLSRSSDLVSCVFYVVDEGGEKLTDKTRQQDVLQGIEKIFVPGSNTCFTRE